MTHLSRRDLLAGASATAALSAAAPGALLAQSAPAVAQAGTDDLAFAARLRALSGFDPLPQTLTDELLAAAREAGLAEAIMEEGGAPSDAQKRALRALYHGIWEGPAEGEDADGPAAKRRLAFADALQWAAIEDTNNVISFCGGLPGFWADPPRTDA